MRRHTCTTGVSLGDPDEPSWEGDVTFAFTYYAGFRGSLEEPPENPSVSVTAVTHINGKPAAECNRHLVTALETWAEDNDDLTEALWESLEPDPDRQRDQHIDDALTGDR